jgi:predicted dehydrogenase/nucleoside-diphosphate-sugar epimerase
MTPIRVAVVGCGSIAERAFLPALMRLKQARVVALVDKDPDRLARLGRHFHIPQVFDDHRQLVGVTDAAIVATPHHLHTPISVDLLRQGIHVLVEKPMTLNVAEAEQVLAAAQEGRAVAAVGQILRSHDAIRWTKAAITNGFIGPVKSFDVRVGYFNAWPAGSDFYFRKESGGGVLLDAGAHTLDLLLWWLGEVESLEYEDDAFGGVEADCELRLNFASGASGTIMLSRTRSLRNTAVLTGEQGEIEVKIGKNSWVRTTPLDLLTYTLDGIQGNRIQKITNVDLFEREIYNWLWAIETGGQPAAPAVEVARCIALFDACRDQRKPLKQPWLWPDSGNSDSTVTIDDVFAGQTVLITSVAGIHGFVGGRLVEMLVRRKDVKIRALVSDFNESPRIARFPVEMTRVDLTDAESVTKVVEGCSVVFNTAHDFNDFDRNITATRILAKACLDSGVKRLVHLSSAAVYEPFHDGIINEDSPIEPCGVGWADCKKAVEAEFMHYAHQQGLPLVIIQPTHVYGPWAYNGTLRPVHHMRHGKVVLPDSSDGLCNTIYVDDLVTVLQLGATRCGVEGERFTVSGPRSITWREFYGAYERMLGVEGVTLRPVDEILGRGVLGNLGRLKQNALKLKDAFPLKQLKSRLSEQQAMTLVDLANRQFGYRLYYPDRLSLKLYLAKARVSYEKAERMLGYKPQYDFERGMELTEQYVRWAGLL